LFTFLLSNFPAVFLTKQYSYYSTIVIAINSTTVLANSPTNPTSFAATDPAAI
jgi:hypothetical protein